jgi:hypothetical protein
MTASRAPWDGVESSCLWRAPAPKRNAFIMKLVLAMICTASVAVYLPGCEGRTYLLGDDNFLDDPDASTETAATPVTVGSDAGAEDDAGQ